MPARLPTPKIRRLPFGIGAVSMALLVTACGAGTVSGGGGSSSGDGQAVTGAGAKNCDNELKLGILTAFSGELGQFGEDGKRAFELAVDQMNSSDALPKGWKVTSVVGDGKTDPVEGVRVATHMIKSERVSAIVGPSSGPIVAMVSLAERSQVPVISHYAGTVSLNKLGGKWVYRTVASDDADGRAAAKWLLDQGVTSAGVLVQNDESTVSIAQQMQKSFTSSGGKISFSTTYNAGQPSYDSTLQKVLSDKPEHIFIAGGQESGVTIIKELRDSGYGGQILLSSDMVVPDVLKALGPGRTDNLQGEMVEADTSLPAYKDFAAAYKDKYGQEAGTFTANAYDAATLVGLAAVASKSTCGAAINGKLRDVAGPPGEKVTSFTEGAKALAAGKDIDYQGASGTVDFDATGTVPGSYAIVKAGPGGWTQAEFYPSSVFAGQG